MIRELNNKKPFTIHLKAICMLSAMVLSSGCKNNGSHNSGREDEIITKEEINDLKREDLNTAGNIVFTKGEFTGMKLFMKNCNRCHPAGEKGKGPSLIDKKIPDFIVHSQVRIGLGDMPSFKKQQLSKEDVKKIILFVRIMREVNLNHQKS